MKKLTIALLGILAAAPAFAAIIYVDLGDVALPAEGDLYINVLAPENTTNTLDFSDFNQAPWLSFHLGGGVIASSDFISPWTNQSADYNGGTPGHFFLNVPAGSTVSSTGVSVPSIGAITGSFVEGEAASEFHLGSDLGQFESGVAGYLVFSYPTVLGGEDMAYGWLRFTPQSSGAGFVVDYAYSDTPGEAITVGAVPEPAAYAALAGSFGLLAAVAFRRRRMA